jgi:galactose oxidase
MNSVSYNQRFFVRTDDAADIASVTMIRQSSVTHQTNTDQRNVELVFERGQYTGNGLWLTAPPNGGIAPTGYYMLFIVNRNGISFEASGVRVG